MATDEMPEELRVEARLAAIEAHAAGLKSDVSHVQADVAELKGDMKNVRDRLARIEVRVEHLPGKGFVVSVFLTSVAVLTAISIFQGKLQALLGLVH